MGPIRLSKNQTNAEPSQSNKRSSDKTPSDSLASRLELPALLTLDRVDCQCELSSKKRTLEKMAELLMDAFDDEELSDMHVLDALSTRERLGSTGIGHGVALPHARMPSLKEPAAALVSLDKGVDFDAIDGHNVDLIVALLVPEDCNDTHLKILRNLAQHFDNPNYRVALRNATTSKELFSEAIKPTKSL